jgi:uncharacterized protein (UPF0303 family)
MDIEAERARVSEQERSLRAAPRGADAAWLLGCRLRDVALARGVALAIEVRLAGQTVFFHAMPGTAPCHADWVRRKRNTAEWQGSSSYAVGLAMRAESTTLLDKTGLPTRDYAQHGGSVALRSDDGVVWGSATVSGLAQRDDHDLLVEVVRSWLAA